MWWRLRCDVSESLTLSRAGARGRRGKHDLGQLIEQVSQTLDVRADSIREPVLQIDDVTERFNVTSKTIQRLMPRIWAKLGHP